MRAFFDPHLMRLVRGWRAPIAAALLAVCLAVPAVAQDGAASGDPKKPGASDGAEPKKDKKKPAAKDKKAKKSDKKATADQGAAPDGGGSGQSADQDLSGEGDAGDEVDTTGRSLAERIQAVSQPVFAKSFRFEVAPFVGGSINDAFYQRLNAGARFSFHILESFAIDGGGAFNPVGVALPTVSFLDEDANNQLVNTAPFWGYADIGVTFAPLYGKFSLMSEMVIHFDAYVSAGLGLTVDGNRNFLWGMAIPSDFIPSVNPAAELGIGFRAFLFRWFAVRMEIRDYIYPHNRGPGLYALQNVAMLNLAASFWFPFDFEYDQAGQR